MFHRPKQENDKPATKSEAQAAPQQPVAPAPAAIETPARAAMEPPARAAMETMPPPQQPVQQPAPQSQPNNQTGNHKYNNDPNPVMNNPTKAEESPMDHNDDHDMNDAQTRPVERPYSNMQSTAPQPQASVQRPRPFAGSVYPGATPSSSNYGNVDSYSAKSEARKLIIGQGINMSGEIECCDHLLVEGSVEASLKGASLLEISETGVFYGTVEIDEATIAGRFEGDLMVNGRLTVRSTGSVTGTITYKEFAVEAGAVVDGKISPLTGAAAGAKKPAAKDGKAKIAPRNDNQGVAGNELPFANNTVEAAE